MVHEHPLSYSFEVDWWAYGVTLYYARFREFPHREEQSPFLQGYLRICNLCNVKSLIIHENELLELVKMLLIPNRESRRKFDFNKLKVHQFFLVQLGVFDTEDFRYSKQQVTEYWENVMDGRRGNSALA